MPQATFRTFATNTSPPQDSRNPCGNGYIIWTEVGREAQQQAYRRGELAGVILHDGRRAWCTGVHHTTLGAVPYAEHVLHY